MSIHQDLHCSEGNAHNKACLLWGHTTWNNNNKQEDKSPFPLATASFVTMGLCNKRNIAEMYAYRCAARRCREKTLPARHKGHFSPQSLQFTVSHNGGNQDLNVNSASANDRSQRKGHSFLLKGSSPRTSFYFSCEQGLVSSDASQFKFHTGSHTGTRSSAQGNCSAKSLAGNVADSSLSSLSSAAGVWGRGRGRGVRGRGQGTFHPPCHILHHHMVLRPEGTSHNDFLAEAICKTRRLRVTRVTRRQQVCSAFIVDLRPFADTNKSGQQKPSEFLWKLICAGCNFHPRSGFSALYRRKCGEMTCHSCSSESKHAGLPQPTLGSFNTSCLRYLFVPKTEKLETCQRAIPITSTEAARA